MADSIQLDVTADTSAVEAAKKRLKELRQELADLRDEFKRNGGSVDDFLTSIRRVEGQITQTQQAVKILRTSGTMDFNHLGMGINQIAQGLEDLQYGVAGAANNLGAAVQMFGGPAGLVAGLTIAGVAVNQLVKHWDGLQAALGMGVPTPALEGPAKLDAELKKAADRMEELQKKTRLTLGELLEFRKVQQQVAEGKAQQEQEKETKAAVGITSANTDQYVQDYQKAVKAAGGGEFVRSTLAAALERGADDKGKVFDTYSNKSVTPQQAAESLMREAAKGDPDAQRRIQETVAGYSSQGAQIAGAFEENSDAGRKQKAAEDAREKAIKDEVELGKQAQANEEKFAKDEEAKQAKKDKQDRELETAIAEQEADVQLGNEKADKEEKQFAEQKRQYELNMIESQLGLGMAQKAMFKNVFGAPERIAAADFAHKAEAGGAKDQLELLRQQLQCLRAVENYTKLAANPPKLGK